MRNKGATAKAKNGDPKKKKKSNTYNLGLINKEKLQ